MAELKADGQVVLEGERRFAKWIYRPKYETNGSSNG